MLYLAGELEPQEAANIRRHQETCARCVALAESLAETYRRVESGLRMQVAAPASLDRRVMAAVCARPAGRAAWYRLLPVWGWKRRFALASAAVFLLIGGFALGYWRARQNSLRLWSPRPRVDIMLLKGYHDKHLRRTSLGMGAPGQGLDQGASLPPPRNMTPLPVDLQAGGARLIGTGFYVQQGEIIALRLFDWKGTLISLFQWKGADVEMEGLKTQYHRGRPYQVGTTDDLSYVFWRSNDVALVMFAHADPESLLNLAIHAGGVPDYYCAPKKH